MKRVTIACVLRPRCDPSVIARSKAVKVTPAPITAATIAVTGKPSGVWTAAKVTTAVIVPGRCSRAVVRGRCLTDRLTAAEHIETHIGNDHSPHDPEHVQ